MTSLDVAAAARLFDVANVEDEVIDAVEDLLSVLKRARAARAELAGLPAADLRTILQWRANTRRGRR